MLYSIAVAIAYYYATLFLIGFMVKAIAIEGALIVLAALCFIGACLVRRYSKLVFRLALGVGVFATTLGLAQWFILPILAGSGTLWVKLIAISFGIVVYLFSRLIIYIRLFRRNRYTRRRPAPPFGREWCRWLLFFVL